MTGAAAVRCNVCGAGVPIDRPALVKAGFEILRCQTCGLAFRKDVPSAAEIESLYGSRYFFSGDDSGGEAYRDYLADEQLHRLNARKRLRMLRSRSRSRDSGRLLDVGAASGFFVDEARRTGWDAEGVDVSPVMVELGRRTLGVPLRRGMFQAVELETGSFDVVTMWDYIEHSVDPAGDLRMTRSLLRPGGLLALSTGDISSLVARVSRSRWHLLTPEHHNFFFSRRSLERALAESGLRPICVRYPAAMYSLRYLTHKLQTLTSSSLPGRAAARFQDSRAGRLPVPVNLWDIMTVMAQKA